jgi:N-methylhydantoinase B
VERTESAPRGLLGGGGGRAAAVLVDGVPVNPKEALTLRRGQELVLETPGGGGFGAAAVPPVGSARKIRQAKVAETQT